MIAKVDRHAPLPRLFCIGAALVLVFAAGTVGSLVTLPVIPTWYATLSKPWFTPPDWLFGPAWTTLYLLMGTAFYRVLRTTPEAAGRRFAIIVFVAHMALNAGWSIAFFGLRSPGAGLLELVLFWPVAVLNAFAFARVDRWAGALMIPNVLWVTFAALVNIAIWRLN